MTITEAAAALRAGKVSSRELVEESLRSIGLNAFITVTEEEARAEARAADEELARGTDRGPLHGLPVAVKDLFWTRGVRTTAGSTIFSGFVPRRDARAVALLREAGAIIAGKTNMHELAYGITSENPHFGPVRNPYNPEYVAGGSSGGSGAAVAGNMVFAALGTDTGGSIRIPASFCGCTGLKPTYGVVSRAGVIPLGYTQDHVGPLARTVRDAAIVLNALTGRRDCEPSEDANLRGLRVGVIGDADPGPACAAGAVAVRVDVPELDEINAIGRMVLLAEASAVYGRHLDGGAKIGKDVRALLEQGRLISATDYINAQRLRRVRQREFRRVWEEADILLAPVTGVTAPRIGGADVRLAVTRWTRPWNVLGLPAISIPAGFDRNGLPTAVQLIAPAFAEQRLLGAAAALERVIGFEPRIAARVPNPPVPEPR